jgi:3-(3-hydroxy-phenyl)propionate hydroxylase
VRHRLIPPLTRGLLDRDQRGEPTRAAGSLFPQPRVETADGRIALMDDILPPVFLVVSDSVEAQAALSDRELEMLRQIEAVRIVLRPEADRIAGGNRDLMTLVAKDELFANWLIDTGASAAVIRPDRYVYGVASNATELVFLVNNLARTLFS